MRALDQEPGARRRLPRPPIRPCLATYTPGVMEEASLPAAELLTDGVVRLRGWRMSDAGAVLYVRVRRGE
jgi:hypothetical protein